MDKIKALEQDLEKTYKQIYNLENIHDNIEISTYTTDSANLTNLYNNIKTFSPEIRNNFIADISKFNVFSSKEYKFGTMRNEQRKFLLEKLKERYTEKKAFIESLMSK